MLIPNGNALRGCAAISPTPKLGKAALPVPDSIACDRVGVGVHLSRPATVLLHAGFG
jgi:hypothetical protein